MSGVNVIAFIAVLVILVLLHEAGHMVVAKACGMGVERFSIFFGRPLVRFRRGETEYRIGWIPAGGYVKITGMTREELVEEVRDERTGEVVRRIPPPEDVQARAYYAKPAWAKIATIFAGPGVNILVAFILFSAVFWYGIPIGIDTNRVAAVGAGTPAAAVGLQPGDRLLSVDGVRATGDLSAVRAELQSHPGRPVTVTYRRGNEVFTRTSPALTRVTDPDGRVVGRLGFAFDQVAGPKRSFGFVGGIREAADYSRFLVTEQVKGLGRLFTSEKARKDVSSVVGIGAIYNDASHQGVTTVLRFVGILSLILAIMNLIPLLPLDGGHILFAIIEKVRGRPMPRASFERASFVGIAILAVLFVYALNNDIGRLTGSGFTP